MSRSWGKIGTSAASQRTSNPIRAIVDMIKPDPSHPKRMLALSIGDPCVDGNLLPPTNVMEAICGAVKGCKHNGYAPTFGFQDARAAVAEYNNKNFLSADQCDEGVQAGNLTSDDVVLSCGASHALGLAIGALCDPGDNILLPQPGFSIYNVISNYLNVETRNYQCLPERAWEVDLDSVRKSLDGKTKAILLNNPSNPCGSNFSRKHLRDIVALAEDARVPIISDEIYAGMTFDCTNPTAAGPPFTAIGTVSKTVPCMVVGGIAKNFVAPGYRVGWLYRHDPTPNREALSDVWPAAMRLSQLVLGPSTVVQAGLKSLLLETPDAYGKELRTTLATNAQRCYKRLKETAEGLDPVLPTGAMYMMVRVDIARFTDASGITDDVKFCTRLMEEENVQVLPGTIFKAPGFFRIVFTRPGEILDEAIDRIVKFTQRHCKQ